MYHYYDKSRYNIAMTNQFIYSREGNNYPVVINRKKIHSIRYKYRDGGFVISASNLTSKEKIIQGLDKFFYRLTKENAHYSGLTDEYVYLLGKRIAIQSEGKINFTNREQLIYESKDELKKKLKKWFLRYITYRHRQYEKQMKCYENKVRVREMYTRYGSNSISHKSITYSSILMHYSPDIIDSVIVHELAHCFEIGHNEKFYKIVRKYCPNYDKLHYKLRKGIYSND